MGLVQNRRLKSQEVGIIYKSNILYGRSPIILKWYDKIDNTSSTHLRQVNLNINAKTLDGCEECLQVGSEWVHVRLCLSCGHVGCCDSSPKKYATKHFKAKHPIIKSFEPGENWKWCYEDKIYVA